MGVKEQRNFPMCRCSTSYSVQEMREKTKVHSSAESQDALGEMSANHSSSEAEEKIKLVALGRLHWKRGRIFQKMVEKTESTELRGSRSAKLGPHGSQILTVARGMLGSVVSSSLSIMASSPSLCLSFILQLQTQPSANHRGRCSSTSQ